MSEQARYIHNPGSIVPVPITADALRYLFNACVQMARVNRIQAAALDNELKRTTDTRRAAAIADVRDLHRTVADQYERMGKEINEAKDETPASQDTIADLTFNDVTVIGVGVYDPRLKAWADDLAELEIRTARVRDLRKQ